MKKWNRLLAVFCALCLMIPTGAAFAEGQNYLAGLPEQMESLFETVTELCETYGKAPQSRVIDPDKPMVALTFDDGPSQYTKRILDCLEEYDARATFFVVGERVGEYSDVLKRTYEMGNEIGNHTYNHKVLTKIDNDAIASQLGKTNDAIEEVLGAAPALMRPPGGGYSDRVKAAVDFPLILWSIDTLDWKTQNADSTVKAVFNDVKDGDIILMHDLYKASASAAERIIPRLIEEGYQLVTVSELAQYRGGMENGKIYGKFRP